MSLFANTVLCVVIASCLTWLLSRRRRRSNEPPIVPHWIPYVGSGLQYRKEPIKFLRTLSEKYGPIFTVYMGGDHYTFVVDPFSHPFIAKEGKKLSFRLHTRLLTKKTFDFIRPLNAPTLAGLMPKYLQGEGLDKVVNVTMDNMHDVVGQKLSHIKEWKKTNLYQFSFDVLFHAIFKTMFGSAKAGLPCDDIPDITKKFRAFDEVFPLLVQGYPISSLKSDSMKVAEVRASLTGLLQLDKRDGAHEMFSDFQTQSSILPESIGPQMLGMLFAGVANSVPSAFWALYFTLMDPVAKKVATDEVRALLKSTGQEEDGDFRLDRQQLAQLPVLDSIIKESLRMGVSASTVRQVVEDMDLRVVESGKYYRVRKGDKVMVLFQLTHYDPEIYEEPNTFKYDRFLNEDGSEKTKFFKDGKGVKYFYQPFGSGLSKCPGRLWAVAEIKQFLALALLKFDFELLNPGEKASVLHGRVGFGTLPPSNPVPIRVKYKTL